MTLTLLATAPAIDLDARTGRRTVCVLAAIALAGCGGGGHRGGSTATYKVGGTINLAVVNALPDGLPGGLTLTDGTDALSVAAHASQFAFPTELPTGRSYTVMVMQSPAGLDCSVANGAGTIGSAAVGNVSVTCVDALFSISGTVTGLSSDGLVLSDGNGHLSPVAVGSRRFALPDPVAFGGAFAVTVQSQPKYQTCIVSNGAGTMGSADVTNVGVECPITVSPTSTNIAAGASLQLTAALQAPFTGALTWQANGVTGGGAATGTVSPSGLYTAPIAEGTFVVSASSGGAAGSATVTVLAPHVVAVRQTSGGAELYDRNTGNAFVARGNNFIRLDSTLNHSTFNVGFYDGAGVDTAFSTMQASGYNTVRVFLQGCCDGSIGDPAGGLSAAYMANVADFLARAKRHGLFVVFTQDWLPAQGGYEPSCPPASSPQFGVINAFNLCPGAIDAARRFHRDFVQALIELGAPLSNVLAYELRNEYFYSSDLAPFTSSSGLVTTANGMTYDMADNAARQQMMDDGLVYFTDQLRAAIVEEDPTALVTVGFFWPKTPNPTRIGDPRVISVWPAMSNSTADFIDIHGYVIAGDLTIDQLVQNYGFVGHQDRQPVIMGEFGVFTSAAPTISSAATALKTWQVAGCAYGLKGWLLWTWDTDNLPPPTLWNALSGDLSINGTLAPTARPDPCVP